MKIKEYGLSENGTSKFDITFGFVEIDEQIQMNIEYNSDLFKKETVFKIANDFEHLLAAINKNPQLHVADLLNSGSEEKRYRPKGQSKGKSIFVPGNAQKSFNSYLSDDF